MKYFYYGTFAVTLITVIVLVTNTAKADKSSDLKREIITIAQMACIVGAQKATKEYEDHGIKYKIKSASELCSEIGEDVQ